jgi:hypothetical protein
MFYLVKVSPIARVTFSNDYDIMKICVIGISEMCSERNKSLKSNAK